MEAVNEYGNGSVALVVFDGNMWVSVWRTDVNVGVGMLLDKRLQLG